MAGTVAGESGFGLGIRFKNPPDFAAVARGCHAHGETVDDPDALIPALKRAVSQVEFGKSAVLDVKIG
jgi:acetolactate synthase-1/2/3 large subunit